MANVTTSTTENKNITETISVDGTQCMRVSANLNGGQAGGCNITIMPTNQTVYQANKEEVRPAIDDFVTNILDQAQAQTVEDTTVTSETAPTEDTAETVSTTKASSKKSK